MRSESKNVKIHFLSDKPCFRLKYCNMCVGRGAQNRGFGVKIQKYEIPWVQNEFLWVPHAFLYYFVALGAHGGPIFN